MQFTNYRIIVSPPNDFNYQYDPNQFDIKKDPRKTSIRCSIPSSENS